MLMLDIHIFPNVETVHLNIHSFIWFQSVFTEAKLLRLPQHEILLPEAESLHLNVILCRKQPIKTESDCGSESGFNNRNNGVGLSENNQMGKSRHRCSVEGLSVCKTF